MGSNVMPYFILTPANVTNNKPTSHQVELEQRRQKDITEATPPTTPAPSGASHSIAEHGLQSVKGRKRLARCEVPIKDIRKRETLSKKMELIKRKLEKSRERFNEKKQEGNTELRCEPMMFGSMESQLPVKMERSVTDLTHDRLKPNMKQQSGSSPYFYFVVTEDHENETPDFVMENGEKIMSKSADKRRRVRIVEENRLKRDRREKQNKTAKMQGLARELGLKSSLKSNEDQAGDSSPSSNSCRIQPTVNHIVYQGPPCEEASFSRGKLRLMSSASGPLCSFSNSTVSGEAKTENQGNDTDENVPRKPFLSGPLYAGKNRGQHTVSTSLFELPNIPTEQKRRALGLSSSTRFEEFAYNAKPRHEQKVVSFSEPLPGIKGNAFSFELDRVNCEQPLLGPRSATVGSIKLPSERTDQQTMCQKFILGENMSSARSVKKFGIPLSLPKIDIVSNVYDEMIIKMIQEYLQDTNTPSRQSQLAKDLLVQLQKHNEQMKEMNVPTVRTGRNGKLDIARHFSNKHFGGQIDFTAPPNTAEDKKRPSQPQMTLEPVVQEDEEIDNTNDVTTKEEGGEVKVLGDGEETNRDITSREAQRDLPFVQITYKNKENEEDGVIEDTDETQTAKAKPCRSSVTPVSFQMAPPGLSKEDTQTSLQLRPN